MRLDSSPAGIKIPKNVLTVKMLPQQSLLAHNQTKVFFNHGGVNSVIEGIHNRVPMVIMPIWWDNAVNQLL